MNRIVKLATVVLCLGVMVFMSQGPAMAEDEINIGVAGPLTGRVAAIGLDVLHGAEIAAKEVNDAGGVEVAGKKYKVAIRPYDDEGVAAKAVAGMQRLKDKYDVPVVLENLSGSVMAMLERNEKMGVLLMGFFKHPDATKKGNKLVLRHQQTINADAMDLARAAVNIFKAKTYAMISDASDYGKASVKAYQEAFKELGVKEVANEWLDSRTQTDFRAQLTKIKAANPDVIMLTAYDEASAGVVKQAHELGLKTPFALSTGFGGTAEKLTGPELIEGYIKRLERTSITPYPPANAKYREKLYPAMGYKEPLAAFGINTYATIHIILRAMQKAGTTTDAAKIRAAIPQVLPLPEEYDTTGITAFTDSGEGVISAQIGKFTSGKLVPVK
ncbi:MAG: ABC transporter substrate-binding protein [Proteobacteria bacterium]|nr:ABC transporter substrate-binding protein [Pseudomonadota bacterium]